MLGILRDLIKSKGPITVAEYFKLALTHPQHGYYMKKDVFGVKGDFTTSPEISQMFGELIAVWIANEHAESGDPRPLHLVELGPGRGTLATDVTRVAAALPQLRTALSGRLLLMEVSPTMRAIQRRVLTSGRPSDAKIDSRATATASSRGPLPSNQDGAFDTAHGFRAEWIDNLDQLPDERCCFLAHEFFDALPVHKLQRLPNGEWREVLVDLAPAGREPGPDPQPPPVLAYRLSATPPPAHLLAHLRSDDPRQHVEVSPTSSVIVQQIGRHVAANRGFGLIADYGYDSTRDAGVGQRGDTLRGFRSHRVRDPLLDPGDSDLTADVDFGQLKRHLAELRLSSCLAVHGPVSQRSFLLQMGMAARLNALMASGSSSPEVRRNHLSAARTLLEDMGQRFQFLCVSAHRLPLSKGGGAGGGGPGPGFLPETKFT